MNQVFEIITVLVFLFCISMLQNMDQNLCGPAYGPPKPPPAAQKKEGSPLAVYNATRKNYGRPCAIVPARPLVKNSPQVQANASTTTSAY